MSNFDLTKTYNIYAKDVIDNKILVGKWIKLACQRYIDWFNRDDVFFDYNDVDTKIRFIQKLKHFRGEFANRPFILYNWQCWIIAGIYGFKYKSTGYRVCENALMFISRKNGKSSLAAALGIVAAFADGEEGAEVACIANSAKQANILFEMIKYYTASVDPHQVLFKRYRNSINIPLTHSKIIVHSSDPKTLDGYNCSTFICDELNAAKDDKVYNLMKNSQGTRTQPLAITITTAGFLLGDEYPLYSMWQTCTDILQGTKEDDTWFCAIYQLDEDDDWKDDTKWKKCSPGYGDIIQKKKILNARTEAINNPSKEVEFKTKLLNQWCSSETVWIPREDLLAHTQKFDVNIFKSYDEDDEYYCYSGVDLGSVSDMTAVAYMAKKDEKFYFKCDMYIPDGAIERSKNKELYRKWIAQGYLKITHGERMNYDEVITDILEMNKQLPIMEIAYDAYNASVFTRSCSEEGLVMTRYAQTKGNFNLATKEFERRLYNGDIIIDDNPIIRWCFANAMLEYDKMENCKPVKGVSSMNKIDAVIAILEAFGTYLNREEKSGIISTI